MSKYAHAGQVSTPSRVLLPKVFLGSEAPLVRKYEFLKTLHLLSGLLYQIQAKAAKVEMPYPQDKKNEDEGPPVLVTVLAREWCVSKGISHGGILWCRRTTTVHIN